MHSSLPWNNWSRNVLNIWLRITAVAPVKRLTRAESIWYLLFWLWTQSMYICSAWSISFALIHNYFWLESIQRSLCNIYIYIYEERSLPNTTDRRQKLILYKYICIKEIERSSYIISRIKQSLKAAIEVSQRAICKWVDSSIGYTLVVFV